MADRFIVRQQTSLSKKTSQLRALLNNALDDVAKELENIADEIIEDARSDYDSALPGETYDRTGDLGRAWHRTDAVTQGNGSIVVFIVNPVVERDPPNRAYSDLVQGSQQTERHQSAGWRTIDEIKLEHSHDQSARVRSAITKAGRKQ